jgi:glucan biosynthesis protein
MSQDAKTSPSTKGFTLFKLVDASQHGQWKGLLQDCMFALFNNVNMDAITPAHTLDQAYFKARFKEEFKAAANIDKTADVFDNDAGFAGLCFKHAIATGSGFKDWLSPTYASIRRALSDQIQRQTDLVRRGDLVALLRAI